MITSSTNYTTFFEGAQFISRQKHAFRQFSQLVNKPIDTAKNYAIVYINSGNDTGIVTGEQFTTFEPL